MTERPTAPDGPDKGRDEEYWAKPVGELHVSHELPDDALNLNVEGKRLAPMAGGFGKMWQKTYRIELEGTEVAPAEVVSAWKENFGSFWPKRGRFLGPMTSLSPGDVAVLNLDVGGGAKLSTGIFVLYADEESFSFINPEGHQFTGMITFSAAGGEPTTAQVQVLIRASDPLYELGMPVMHRVEDRFWKQTLANLAAHFGVEASATMERVCVDRKRQWSQWRNMRRNAGVRSMVHTLGAPFRALAKPFRRSASVSD